MACRLTAVSSCVETRVYFCFRDLPYAPRPCLIKGLRRRKLRTDQFRYTRYRVPSSKLSIPYESV